MNIQRATPVNDFLARLIFLILPTALVGYFLLQNVNSYFTILNNQVLNQTLYFVLGMASGALFYAFRFRFLPTFALLVAGFYFIY
jgi:protein-glutamine gamma-glutamyltransferase